MGKSSAETVREIKLTRERLDSELTELQDRLPTPAQWGKRLLGVAFGGGVAGSMFWFGVRSLRKRKKRKAEQQRVQELNACPTGGPNGSRRRSRTGNGNSGWPPALGSGCSCAWPSFANSAG